MRTRYIRVAGIALTTLVLIGSAYPNIIFTSDNLNIGLGNVDVDAVLGGAPLGSALPGTIASAGRSVAVELTSDSDKLTGTGGSGNICRESCTPATLPIRNVTLQLPGFGFTHIVLNPQKASGGDLTYTVFTCKLISNDLCVEEPKPFTTKVPGNNGQNFMSITADAFSSCGQVAGCVPGDEVITRVTLDAPNGFNTLNQIRISNSLRDLPSIDVDVIPEPSSMLLLGTGVLVFTQVLRRKLKHGFGTRSA